MKFFTLRTCTENWAMDMALSKKELCRKNQYFDETTTSYFDWKSLILLTKTDVNILLSTTKFLKSITDTQQILLSSNELYLLVSQSLYINLRVLIIIPRFPTTHLLYWFLIQAWMGDQRNSLHVSCILTEQNEDHISIKNPVCSNKCL